MARSRFQIGDTVYSTRFHTEPWEIAQGVIDSFGCAWRRGKLVTSCLVKWQKNFSTSQECKYLDELSKTPQGALNKAIREATKERNRYEDYIKKCQQTKEKLKQRKHKPKQG